MVIAIIAIVLAVVAALATVLAAYLQYRAAKENASTDFSALFSPAPFVDPTSGDIIMWDQTQQEWIDQNTGLPLASTLATDKASNTGLAGVAKALTGSSSTTALFVGLAVLFLPYILGGTGHTSSVASGVVPPPAPLPTTSATT